MKKASGWGIERGLFLPRVFGETKIVARQDFTSIGPLGIGPEGERGGGNEARRVGGKGFESTLEKL